MRELLVVLMIVAVPVARGAQRTSSFQGAAQAVDEFLFPRMRRFATTAYPNETIEGITVLTSTFAKDGVVKHYRVSMESKTAIEVHVRVKSRKLDERGRYEFRYDTVIASAGPRGGTPFGRALRGHRPVTALSRGKGLTWRPRRD